MMRSLLGGLISCLRTGISVRKEWYLRASAAEKKHQDDTKANCIRVRVTGFGKAMRMDLEDVFDMMDVAYQIPHRNCPEPSISMSNGSAYAILLIQKLADSQLALERSAPSEHLPVPERSQ